MRRWPGPLSEDYPPRWYLIALGVGISLAGLAACALAIVAVVGR